MEGYGAQILGTPETVRETLSLQIERGNNLQHVQTQDQQLRTVKERNRPSERSPLHRHQPQPLLPRKRDLLR